MNPRTLPRPAVLLGLSGIAPQAVCLALVLADGPYRWAGLAAGCFYAALILSFLGGLWWMAALRDSLEGAACYFMAVLATLAGWVALLPWVLGWQWPGPSLTALGVMLLASPLVDRRLSTEAAPPPGWLRLRVLMAVGLGSLTLALAIASR